MSEIDDKNKSGEDKKTGEPNDNVNTVSPDMQETGEGIKTTLPGPQQDELPGRVDPNNQIIDPSTSGPKKPKSKDNFDSDDLERKKI